jgi:outer membrane protein OmpA-like peptidoglycan-associated protein
VKKSRISALLIAGAFVGCASQSNSGPTGSLVRARNLQQQAAGTNARKLAPAEMQKGDQLLAGAEKQHQADPRSNMEYHLANLAASNYEIAMAEARRKAADDQYVVVIIEQSKTMAARQPKLEEGEGMTFEQTPEGLKVTVTGAVLFRVDESELLPVARERLQKVADAIRDGEGKVIVEGHADSTGTDEHNDRLSQERAESVKAFLVEHGIPAERVNAVGRGEREPVATNETPEGRADNRRVELEIRDDEA